MSKQPRKAAYIGMSVCSHGTFFLDLYDDDGNVFAQALLSSDQAARLAGNITTELAGCGLTIGECAGNA